MMCRPPMPPIVSSKLLAPVFGHLLDVLASKQPGRFSYRVIQHFDVWYKSTKSKTFRVRLGLQEFIITKDPQLYKKLLGPFQKHFSTSVAIRATVQHFVPQSIFCLDNDHWTRLRKTITKSLALQSLEYIPAHVAHSVDKMDNGLDPLVVVPEDIFPKLAFDIFHQTVYNCDSNTIQYDAKFSPLLEKAHVMTNAMGERLLVPMPWLWKLPLKHNRMADAARDDLMAMTIELVDKRRAELLDASLPDHVTVLDAMILASLEKQLSPSELYDNVMGLFIAAFDTMSSTLSILFNYLAVNPDVQAKLRQALLEHFPNGHSDVAKSTTSELEKVAYLQWTLDEIFRFAPSVVVLNRVCVKPCEINGVHFEMGDEILVHNGGASHDSDNFHGQMDLNIFRPDRFGEMEFDKSISLPFGAGGRMCPGRKLAIAEIRALCAYIVLKYKISRPAHGPPLQLDTKIGITTMENHGNMLWTPRLVSSR